MVLVDFPSFVRCSFYPEKYSASHRGTNIADVFFAQTKDLSPGISSIMRYINKDDQLKAGNFLNIEDNLTNLICYTVLRMVLSKKMNIDPKEITYIKGPYGKPMIKDDLLFFNISHTRNSFAIAISGHCNIGVDLEEMNKSLNYGPIIKRFFSGKECDYILGSKKNSMERFFLLWTRKEALLKSMGIGIVPHLSDLEVYKRLNLHDRNSFENFANGLFADHYYIYSRKIESNYISVASPLEAKVNLYRLNENNLNTFIL